MEGRRERGRKKERKRDGGKGRSERKREGAKGRETERWREGMRERKRCMLIETFHSA